MEKIIFNTILSNRIEILLKIRENFESMQLRRQLLPTIDEWTIVGSLHFKTKLGFVHIDTTFAPQDIVIRRKK